MAPSPRTSSALSEAASDDFNEYDIISDSGPRSLDSSLADLEENAPAARAGPPHEIFPTPEAKRAFETAALSPEDVQAYVQRSVKGPGTIATRRRSKSRDPSDREKTVRVYVDGVFDVLHTGNALQLRQAKLSFPSVHLLVGPFTGEQCQRHEVQSSVPYVERCELLRHCRWVDEIVPDAPAVLDEAFLTRNRIDYVAVEEGSSVNPAVNKARLAGYDLVKTLGKAISTRRTRGVVASTLITPRDDRSSSSLTVNLESLTLAPAREDVPSDAASLPDDPPEPKEEFGS